MTTYQEEYRRKLISASDAARLVEANDLIEYGMMVTRPWDFDAALGERAGENGLTNVRIRVMGTVEPIPQVVIRDPEQKSFIYGTWYLTGVDRRIADNYRHLHWPFNYHEVNHLLSNPQYQEKTGADVWCAQVNPMDKHGYFNFGLSASHNRTSALNARVAIVEVNQTMPRCLGGYEEAVHISEIDYIIEGNNRPIHAAPPQPAPSPEQTKIAELVMEELYDGCCLQLGIGALPNAIGMMIAASDLKDLGIHSEMFCDAFVAMHQAGRVTNAKKAVDRYKTVFSFALGTRDTYDFLDDNPGIAACPVNYTNDPCRIRLNDNMVAINNILEADLYGQVCSESKGTRQISGTGGQLDFTVGAFESQGGKSFLAFTSTYTDRQGQVHSRVLPTLTSGGIVTVPRVLVNWLVTEYGKVNLKGLSVWDRAEAVISIAHPKFQDELVKAAELQGIWKPSQRLT